MTVSSDTRFDPPGHGPGRCLELAGAALLLLRRAIICLGFKIPGVARSFLAAVALATVAWTAAQAQGHFRVTDGECRTLDTWATETQDGFRDPFPRAPGAAWLYRWLGTVELLGLSWTAEVPADGMIALQPATAAALLMLPDDAGRPSGFPLIYQYKVPLFASGERYVHEFYETYRPPPGLDSPASSAAYNEAARAYRAQDWAEAIRRMDEVAADATSPYRAAAAYTAARAALTMDAGAMDGLRRLRALLADPALAEFHLAGERLLGTLATRIQSPFLIRASLAELFQRAAAPASVVCGDRAWTARLARAHGELFGRADYAFADMGRHKRGNVYDGTEETWRAWDELARLDPVAALARAELAPAPHRSGAGWLPGGEVFRWPQPVDQLTAPLRAMATATQHPVWIAAYAERTEAPQDLPLLEAGWRAVVGRIGPGAAGYAAADIGATLLIHRARLLVAAGQRDAAVEALREGDPWLTEASHRPVTAGALAWQARGALIGGARRLAADGDEQAAGAWLQVVQAIPWVAAALQRMHPDFVFSRGWEPLEVRYLAVRTPEALVGPWRMSLLTRAVLDLQPARELIRLSGLPAVRPNERRALFAVGFVRLHLLGRDAEALRHLTAMRALFPELEAEISDLAARPGDSEQALVRFLLRLPGFTPRLLYWREIYSSGARRDMLRVIERWNLNDQNWWCRLDPKWMRAQAYGLFLQEVGADTAMTSPLIAMTSTLDGYYYYGFRIPLAEDRSKAVTGVELDSLSEPFSRHTLLANVDWAELELLSLAEPGPIRLGRSAIRRAERTGFLTRLLGRDEGLAEELHLAVRATRYGCRRESGVGAVSRDAFRHLHRLYPGSEWARRTPYWFDLHKP